MALIPKSQREQWRAELEAARTERQWDVQVQPRLFGDGTPAAFVMDRPNSDPDPRGIIAYEVGEPEARLIASAPTAISALLAENDELRRMVREACGIAGVLAIELRACYAELGEEYDMGDDERIAELAREVEE